MPNPDIKTEVSGQDSHTDYRVIAPPTPTNIIPFSPVRLLRTDRASKATVEVLKPTVLLRKPIGAGLWVTGALSVIAIVTVLTLAKLGYAPTDQTIDAVTSKDSRAHGQFGEIPDQSPLPIPSRDLFSLQFPLAASAQRN